MPLRAVRRLKVKPARIHHARLVARVVRESFAEYAGASKRPMSARLSPEQVRRHIKSGRKQYALAYVDGRAAGAIGYRIKGRRLTFGPVGVLPKRRKSGVGSALVAWVERKAKAKKCREIRADVLWGLAHLKTYYKNRGYRIVEKDGRTYAIKKLARPKPKSRPARHLSTGLRRTLARLSSAMST